MPNKTTPRRQHGFSLLEVLVAIVILSFGLLGLAALQINATRTNQSSYQRAQVTMLSYLIFDAMRANQDENYGTGMTCTTPAAGTSLKSRDLNLWFTALKAQVGDFDSTCAQVTCNGDGLCTVSIQWDDRRAVEGSSQQTFSFTSRL